MIEGKKQRNTQNGARNNIGKHNQNVQNGIYTVFFAHRQIGDDQAGNDHNRNGNKRKAERVCERTGKLAENRSVACQTESFYEEGAACFLKICNENGYIRKNGDKGDHKTNTRCKETFTPAYFYYLRRSEHTHVIVFAVYDKLLYQ